MPRPMYTQDVFMVLTACDHKNKASSAFKLPHNFRWLRPAVGGVAEKPTIDSREATPAEDPQSDDEAASTTDRLVVTFTELSKKPLDGVHMGTNPTVSHILLGHRGTKGISGRQYKITVDEDLQIWLHDYHSTHGTAVSYDGQNQRDVRKRETWILAFTPGTRHRFREITVHSGSLAVKVEFPNHETADSQYLANLRALVDRCRDTTSGKEVDASVMDELGLDSRVTTQASSDAPTPSERLIYYKDRRIGKGVYGEVYRLVRARDGKFLAAKTFSPPPNGTKRQLDESDPNWIRQIRKEFTVMRDHPHPNIMQVFEFRETPEPMMIMTYYLHGNIVDAGIVDEDQYVTVFGQMLDGLKHLHSKGVAHRDLKPANLLVEMDPFFKVVITDFGLANVATDTTVMKTFCGSLKYAAPEVFPGMARPYECSVDLWSLGVIILEGMYGTLVTPGVPTPETDEHVTPQQWMKWLSRWCGRIVKKLNEQDEDQVVEILLHVLKIKPSERWSASTSLTQGFKGGLFRRRVADGLVVCQGDFQDLDLPIDDGNAGTRTPISASPRRQVRGDDDPDVDPNATIVLKRSWGGGRSSHSRQDSSPQLRSLRGIR